MDKTKLAKDRLEAFKSFILGLAAIYILYLVNHYHFTDQFGSATPFNIQTLGLVGMIALDLPMFAIANLFQSKDPSAILLLAVLPVSMKVFQGLIAYKLDYTSMQLLTDINLGLLYVVAGYTTLALICWLSISVVSWYKACKDNSIEG